MQGRVVADKYELRDELGRGGMGTVWRARDLKLERDVALKLMAAVRLCQAVIPSMRERRDGRIVNVTNTGGKIADSVLDLVDAPDGERPFRTVRDGMGMAEPIEAINAASEQAMTGIYTAFQMDGMLKLNTAAKA